MQSWNGRDDGDIDGSVFKCGARDDVWKNFLPGPVLPLAASQDLPDGFLAASKCSLEFHHSSACVVLAMSADLIRGSLVEQQASNVKPLLPLELACFFLVLRQGGGSG